MKYQIEVKDENGRKALLYLTVSTQGLFWYVCLPGHFFLETGEPRIISHRGTGNWVAQFGGIFLENKIPHLTENYLKERNISTHWIYSVLPDVTVGTYNNICLFLRRDVSPSLPFKVGEKGNGMQYEVGNHIVKGLVSWECFSVTVGDFKPF